MLDLPLVENLCYLLWLTWMVGLLYSYKFSRVLIFAHSGRAKFENFGADLFSRTLNFDNFRADLFSRTPIESIVNRKDNEH